MFQAFTYTKETKAFINDGRRRRPPLHALKESKVYLKKGRKTDT